MPRCSFALLSLVLAGAPALAQEFPAPPVLPGPVTYPMKQNKVGHAQSWDGRILFQSFNVPDGRS